MRNGVTVLLTKSLSEAILYTTPIYNVGVDLSQSATSNVGIVSPVWRSLEWYGVAHRTFCSRG